MGVGNRIRRAVNQEKTRKVLRIVLDVRFQNLCAVIQRRGLAGDGRRMTVPRLHQLLYAARRVVEGIGLHARMRGDKAAALRQRHRVRKYSVNVRRRSAGDGNQVVMDAQHRLAHHLNVVFQQQVEVFGDRSGQAVFDGNYRAVGPAVS